MSKRQTKIALTFGAIVTIILLLLWFRKGGAFISNGGNVTQTNGGYSGGNITFDIKRAPFEIPAFSLPPDQFSMISGCCSDCSSRASNTTSYLPANYGNTFVFNAADQGPTIYNYYPEQEPINPLAYAGPMFTMTM